MSIGLGLNGLGLIGGSGFSYSAPADETGNLVDIDLTNWSQFRVTAPSASVLRETADNNTHVLRYAMSVATGGVYDHKFDIKPEGRTRIHLGYGTAAGTCTPLLTGAGSFDSVGANISNESIQHLGGGYYRISFQITLSTGPINFDIRTADATSGLSDAYVGDAALGYQIHTPRVLLAA